MKLLYRQAIIAICDDLTSPTARSMPVASLLVAESEGRLLAAAALGLAASQLEIDPISRAVLEDVPELLKRHIKDALPAGATSSVDEVMFRLHDSLRNSLHVSEILAPETIEVADEKGQEELTQVLVRAVARGFARAFEAAAQQPSPPSFLERLMPRLKRPATRKMPFPTTSVWPLDEGQEVACAAARQ